MRSAFGLQRVGQRGLVNLLDAPEIECMDLDVTLLAAPHEQEGNEGDQMGKPMAYSRHGDTASPHAVPELLAGD